MGGKGGWENSLLEQLITSGNRDHAFFVVWVWGTSQQGKKKVRKSRQGAGEPIMACPSIGERALESCPVFYFRFFGVTFSCEGSVKCRCAWWAVDDV